MNSKHGWLARISPDDWLTWAALGLATLLTLFLPGLSNYTVGMLVLMGVYAIALLGLDFVVGYVGEVSVGHAGLYGMGAYAAGCLSYHFGLPMHQTLLLAVAVGAATGWVLGLPALRVQGPYLTLMTLAFGYVCAITLSEAASITLGQEGLRLGNQHYLGRDLLASDYYLIVLGLLVLAVVAVNRIAASSLGRAFEALRDSPIATDCMGVGVGRHKILAFALSGGFAGLAGALFAYSQSFLIPNTFVFETSLTMLLALLLGGKRSRFGALFGAGLVVWLPQWLSDVATFRNLSCATLALLGLAALSHAWRRRPGIKALAARWLAPLAVVGLFAGLSFFLEQMTDYRLAIYGAIVLLSVHYIPEGLMGLLPRHTAHLIRPRNDVAPLTPIHLDGEVLRVEQVRMSFGGFNALSDLALSMTGRQVLGLIGPNGAGKSTLINVLTGLYPPSAGRVLFRGEDTSGESVVALAQRGLARTFQNLQIFANLTVLDNVLVGLHRHTETNLLKILLGLRAKDHQVLARAHALLDIVGLADHAADLARNLPYGQQRFLEIARALATDPVLLLLDEPAAGLRGEDLARLKALIGRIRDAGIAVILIEHHMDVVMELSDRVAVLDFGLKIAEDSPGAIQDNPAVREAYLGAA